MKFLFRSAILGPLFGIGALVAVSSPPASGELSPHGGLTVQILLDNSASMYPGYQPPGTPHPSLGESGGLYFAQYPKFGEWLKDFAGAQSILGASRVTLKAFTSTGDFRTSDVLTLQELAVPGQFDPTRLEDLPRQGRHTYLRESLNEATRGFEGLVWLITDNIVEDRVGVPDQGVARFFQELSQTGRYRAVHLYKLPFADVVSGKPGNLALYGILVSEQPLEPEVVRQFDRKFRGELLGARRPSGQPLLPSQAYWKLKDLSVGMLGLEIAPRLEVEIIQRRRSLFRESQDVELRLVGRITSRLTQHRIVEGSYRIVPSTEFKPGDEQGQDYGLASVAASVFESPTSSLPTIDPRTSVPIETELLSTTPVRLETRGPKAWLQSASRGLTVTYKGRAQAHFTGLVAEFDRRQMDGIFGASAAPEIFRIPSRIEVPGEISNSVALSFDLTTGYGRQLLFALLLLAVVLLVGGALWLFGRAERFRYQIDGNEKFLSLRRLASQGIDFQGHRLGSLKRRISGKGIFVPNNQSAAAQIKLTDSDGRFEVVLRDQEIQTLEIEKVGGGPVPAVGQEVRPSIVTRDRIKRPRPGAPPQSTSSTSPEEERHSSPPQKTSRPTIRRPGS